MSVSKLPPLVEPLVEPTEDTWVPSVTTSLDAVSKQVADRILELKDTIATSTEAINAAREIVRTARAELDGLERVMRATRPRKGSA